MSTVIQALRLCTVALVAAGALAWLRGVPSVPAADASGAAACHAPAPGLPDAVEWISQDQARSLAEDPAVAFVDCRPEQEFAAGHVPGSLHLEEQMPPGPALEQLAGMRTVIAYCDADRQCERSFRVASLLRKAGIHDVRVLEGGLPVWLERGYPAESGECDRCEASQ